MFGSKSFPVLMFTCFQANDFFLFRPSQIARSLIDNSNQTYGGQSINICTHDKDILAPNKTWIKKKDNDLQRKKLINL